MITSVIEMLELPNFGHFGLMIISTLPFESRDKILYVAPLTELRLHNLYFKIPLF